MEILWPALGICAIVIFVFFVLAQHWQRILRHQSWTIRQLQGRVRDLEEMGDPELRRRLGEAVPSPLEQVLTFSLRLNERFWRDTLRVSTEDLNFIRASGSFLGSVKIERWRGHTVAAITEVLPESQSAGWQTRSLDFYPSGVRADDALTLWELPLRRPRGSAERPPSLELLLRPSALELCGSFLPAGSGNGHPHASGDEKIVFLRVPLEATLLAEFRSHDPLSNAVPKDDPPSARNLLDNGNSWQAFYSHQDEELGIDWQLWYRDLEKKVEWERWRILESASVGE
jgi:hypothetical protein